MGRGTVWIILIAILAAGCTPSWYRADADRQVNALIKDRQAKTIGYEPEVEVATPSEELPPPKTYDRLPTTDYPPPQTPAIVVPAVIRTFRAIGPQIDEDPLPRQSNFQSNVRVIRMVLGEGRLGPPVPIDVDALRFALFDSISYAVENSRAYRNEMDSLYITALDVTLQRHLFSPRPFARGSLRYGGGQLDSDYQSALTAAAEAGVRQRLPYGGEIVASGLVEFVNGLNASSADGENAELALQGTIPLLRNAGMINLEALIQSERDLVYAVRDFETFRRNFSIQVASAYFRLLTQQSSIRNRYVRYVSSIDLTARTEALFKAGRISALEVQRAVQEQLTAEDDLNVAIQDYENDLDDFKLLLGMPIDQPLIIVQQRIIVPEPELNIDSVADIARRYRLDLQTARDRVEDAQRSAQNARNQLLPDLDLEVGSSIGNRNETPAKAIDSRTLDYFAGISLDLPIDRLPERNAYRRALIALDQASRDVEQADDLIIADARSAVRGIQAAQTTLDLQLRGIEIAQARLDFANESLNTSRATDSRDVVEAQNSLLQAQDRYESATANAQIAILQYLRDTGLLRLNPESGVLGMAMQR